MSITLADDDRRQAISSLRRYCVENLEADLSDIEGGLLLDFVLKEIAPSVYNAAISDAQTFLRDRVADLEGACYQPEFAYWPKGKSVRRGT